MPLKHLQKIVFLMLFSLLLNSLLPFYTAYAGDEQADFRAVYGEELIICTEMGLEILPAARANDEHRPPIGGEHGIECGACYLAAHGLHLADFAAPLPLPVPLLRARLSHRLATERLSAATLIHRIKARAPPHLS